MFPISSKAFIFLSHLTRYCSRVGSLLEANGPVLAGQGELRGSVFPELSQGKNKKLL